MVSLYLAALLLTACSSKDIAGQLERLTQDFPRQLECFAFFNACRPMGLEIEPLHDDAAAISLTQEALRSAVESHLRTERLYTEEHGKADFAYLYVNVTVGRWAFNILVQYHKRVTDAFGESGLSPTWDFSITGMHGGDAGGIVSIVSQILDEFLAAYLRVNESACESASAQPLSPRPQGTATTTPEVSLIVGKAGRRRRPASSSQPYRV